MRNREVKMTKSVDKISQKLINFKKTPPYFAEK